MIRRETFEATLGHFLRPMTLLLEDDEVSEIMVNGPREIFVERRGRLEKTEHVFADNEALMAAVTNIAQFVGRPLRSEESRLDARLPQGHRVHVILPPLCRNGISMTIRKHSRRGLSLDDLVDGGTLNREAADYLARCLADHHNLLVAGGTGTGKTTLLNALSDRIPAGERIVVIEDSAELELRQEHVISLETRPADRKGRGAVSIRDLLHAALRMRPDRIIVGECRGGEALDLLQALNTGHGGSMSTLHADSPIQALERLETLALFGGVDIPLRFLRAQVTAAIHRVVQLERLGGRRIVRSISAARGLDETGSYRVTEVFTFDVDTGELQATGI